MRNFRIVLEFFNLLQILPVSPISVSSFEGWLPSMKWKMHNIISIINSLRLFSWHSNLVMGLVACGRGGNYRAGLMRTTIHLITSNSWSLQNWHTFNPYKNVRTCLDLFLISPRWGYREKMHSAVKSQTSVTRERSSC